MSNKFAKPMASSVVRPLADAPRRGCRLCPHRDGRGAQQRCNARIWPTPFSWSRTTKTRAEYARAAILRSGVAAELQLCQPWKYREM